MPKPIVGASNFTPATVHNVTTEQFKSSKVELLQYTYTFAKIEKLIQKLHFSLGASIKSKF